ncbi:uncharacterized protein [Glycine max]|uniref:uncharacterized protein n=1 Tax=Glycine max TaxID=3847 RepID=UPI0003DECD13|nr:uncharacterized protein LOC102666172 [Glycine max]|eukprot:XP_006579199.1 uncharacterized protein LOC102666172 [Glycine max]
MKEVRSFLGDAGFCKRFIQDFSKIALPLSKLLQKDVDFVLDQPGKEALEELKRRLTTSPIMHPLDWELTFELMCHTSNYALGAILSQRVDRLSHIITYASRTLDAEQVNYTTTKNKFLAIVLALDKFKSYLLCSHITVFTDHAILRDRSGAENLIEGPVDSFPIRNNFPDDHLIQLHSSHVTPWFADIVNFIVPFVVPPHASRSQIDKLKSDAKYYVWDDPYLWRFGSDQVIRRVIFGKACHLLVEIEHHAYWVVKGCNMAFDEIGMERKLQLHELEEIRLDVYENSKIHKKKVKRFYDSRILMKEFHIGQKLRLKMKVIGKVFKVNGHQLKLFHESPQVEEEFVADSLVLPILCDDVP